MSDAANGPGAYPLPEINEINRPFWEAARDGQLMIQRCTECESTIYPPRAACPQCFSDIEWFEAQGKGTVFTYSVVHRPSKPEVFEEKLPIISSVVELSEGPKILTNLLNCQPENVEIGMEVSVCFEEVSDGVILPQFEPINE